MDSSVGNKRYTIFTYLVTIILLVHLAIVQVSIFENPRGSILLQIPLTGMIISIIITQIHGIYRLLIKNVKPTVYSAAVNSSSLLYSFMLLIIVISSFIVDPWFIYFGIMLTTVIVVSSIHHLKRNRDEQKRKIRLSVIFVVLVALFLYTRLSIDAMMI